MLPLSRDATLRVWPQQDRAVIRVEAAGRQPLEISIEMTAAGPLLKACAAAVEMQAEQIALGCKQFSVHAQDRIDIRSGGDIVTQAGGRHEVNAEQLSMEAKLGSVSIRANDDVQLLGEQLLLNCERPAPLPAWLPRVQAQAPLGKAVPLSGVSGDASLLHDLDHAERRRR